MCFCEFTLYNRGNFYYLNEAKIIDSFQDLLDDLFTLTYASYICELADVTVADNEKNANVFYSTIKALYLLRSGVIDSKILLMSHELKLILATGYDISLDKCTRCGERIDTADYVDLDAYGGICDKCEKSKGIYIKRGSYKMLKYILGLPLEKIHIIKMNDDTKTEINRIIRMMLSQITVRRPKSLDFIEHLNNMTIT